MNESYEASHTSLPFLRPPSPFTVCLLFLCSDTVEERVKFISLSTCRGKA